MHRGLEIQGEVILRHGIRLGMLQGDTVYLLKEIAGIDKRDIRQHYEQHGRHVQFAQVGDVVFGDEHQ